MNVTGLDGIYLNDKEDITTIIGSTPIVELTFNIDGYDAGFDVLLDDGRRIKVRVSTMPSADNCFIIHDVI